MELNREETLEILSMIIQRKAELYYKLAEDMSGLNTIKSLHKLEEKLAKSECLEGD